MFFSHTIKAQHYNMQLLDKILELNIWLVDYECIWDDKERLVAFGRYAGIAGVVDFFWGIGEFLLTKKYHNPFLYVGSSYMYPNLEGIKVCMQNLGNEITIKGLPKAFAPYVFAVTSRGWVAQGALETL